MQNVFREDCFLSFVFLYILHFKNTKFKKQFSRIVLPALEAHDAILISRLGEWEIQLNAKSESDAPPPDKKKKKPVKEKSEKKEIQSVK